MGKFFYNNNVTMNDFKRHMQISENNKETFNPLLSYNLITIK